MNLREVELRKLQHVAALARARSFAKAAEELHLTQSALTRSIQSIEKRFSIRLFDRDRAGVNLTVVGREFLKRAQSLLVEANDLARFADRSGRGEVGEVAFGLSTLPAKLFLAPLAVDLFSRRPEVRLSVAVRDAPDLLKLLVEEGIEFFLAGHVPASVNAALEVTEVAEYQSVFAVRAGHPLLSLGAVTLKDVAPYPMLVGLFEPDARPSTNHLRYVTVVNSNDYCALQEITQRSDAIWLTTLPIGTAMLPEAGLVRLPLPTPLEEEPMTLKVVRLARRTLSAAAREVLADLTERCRRMGGG